MTPLSSMQSLMFTDDSDIDTLIALLTTPLNEAQITTPIAVIGTADDANLLCYTLTLVSRNNRAFRQRSTSGTSSVIDEELSRGYQVVSVFDRMPSFKYTT